MAYTPKEKVSDTIYKIDASNSKINWKGYKTLGSQEGTVLFDSGSLELDGDNIIGGNFTVNMSSIAAIEHNERLENHLKSADFFDVASFPNATFKIINCTTKNDKLWITGEITIKNITKEIAFPASLKLEGHTAILTTDTFQINRTDFTIKYKSKSFFDNLKDKFIEDNFDLQVTIVATN